MANEFVELGEYEKLNQIIRETFEHLAQTGQLKLGFFLQQMEEEFTRLGFREESAGNEVKNILLLSLDAVGDFVVTSPAIRSIRENFPAARITLVVPTKVYPLAELCPYVNEVLIYDWEEKFSAEVFLKVTDFARKNLWKRRFDLCFRIGVVYRPEINFLSYLSGARERICLEFSEIDKFFNTKCIENFIKAGDHISALDLYFLLNVGLKVNDTRLEVWYNKTDLFTARNLLKNFAQGRIKIALGIGAYAPARKYPVEKYFVALKEIISRGAAVIILGGKDELDDAKFLEENLPAECVKNFVEVGAGWRVDTAVISQSDLYMGNMTGVCDIAAALNKPIITLSRVAKRLPGFSGIHNETISYRPLQSLSFILQPEHQLDECRENPSYFGCVADHAHCIAQIEPKEIVAAYDEIIKLMKFRK